MKIKPVERKGGVVVELGPKEAQLPSDSAEAATPNLPELTLKRILVPVDFTACTEKALQYAVAFAHQFGAELTLLHVVEPSYMPASEMGIIPDGDSTEDAQKEMQSLVRRLDRAVRYRTLLRKGGAQYEIIDAAKELGSDLIILSTHGRTGLERILLGSTAEKIVRHAGCPLLVVRENEHEFLAGDQAQAQTRNPTGEVQIEAEMVTGL
jgi:universal stress protein A